MATVRVAFIGKGGAGKSAIAGIFCRLLAQQSEQDVVAIDSDPMPGLAVSLGIPSSDTALPEELIEEVEGGGEGGGASGATYRLRPGIDVLDAMSRCAGAAPDGVRLLQFGKLRGHVRALAASQRVFTVLVRELVDTDAHLVGDLPGGTRQPFFGWGDFADTLVVVAEPTPASMLSARRLARVGRRASDGEQRIVAVANGVQEPGESERIATVSGLEVVGCVPRDPAVGAAERAGVALLDHAPEAPAVEAVRSLVEALSEERR